eukprot:668440-Pleurochrysis_carterae.AAC.1
MQRARARPPAESTQHNSVRRRPPFDAAPITDRLARAVLGGCCTGYSGTQALLALVQHLAI